MPHRLPRWTFWDYLFPWLRIWKLEDALLDEKDSVISIRYRCPNCGHIG